MKKDVVYTMRMSSRVRESLKLAAQKERRTVASLLDKIIIDYLEAVGLLKESTQVEDRRRFEDRRQFARKKIRFPATTYLREASEVNPIPSVVLDLSEGGILVTHAKGVDFGFSAIGKLPKLEIGLETPRTDSKLLLKCDARHMRDTGSEIQIGAAFTDLSENELERLNEYLM